MTEANKERRGVRQLAGRERSLRPAGAVLADVQLQAAGEPAFAGLDAQRGELDQAIQQSRLAGEVLLPAAEMDVAQVEPFRGVGTLGRFGRSASI